MNNVRRWATCIMRWTRVRDRVNVHAELGEIGAGKKPGHESREEVTIFDSTGTALQDVAAAVFLYEKAQRDGSGVRLDFAA